MRGSTPLRAALARHVLLEAGARLGLACGQILWGVEAFFDSFTVAKVVRGARDLGYPARLLAVVAQQRPDVPDVESRDLIKALKD